MSRSVLYDLHNSAAGSPIINQLAPGTIHFMTSSPLRLRHISVTAWQRLTLTALWAVINQWHETYCCLFHILCQLKRLPNIFQLTCEQDLQRLKRKWWQEEGVTKGEGASAGEWELRGHVIDIYDPTSLCRCQYVHLRGWALTDASVRERAAGAWRRPSISSLHKSLCLLLTTQHSLSLWPSICPASLVLLFYSYPFWPRALEVDGKPQGCFTCFSFFKGSSRPFYPPISVPPALSLTGFFAFHQHSLAVMSGAQGLTW